ncbi:hypothetical protein H5410_027449 [Solanum commersonii]|uniref:Uncharacterized protein n=1 Tax=Solanum commersonii TaxID=4109 RepID=A0A9J5Z1A7_SOLCO|nr:hypothetical protein H5410_027449 [Solanum commersonii]
MSERLFEGDLPEGRNPESHILAAGALLVAVQSLASLRGDVKPTLVPTESRSPEQVPFSVQPMFDQTPTSFDVEIKSAPKSVPTDKPTEFAKERKRKGKGKMVESHSKGDNKRYGSRSEMQKVMGSAIATSIIQMERARKRRKEGHEPEKPTSTPLHVGFSDSEDKEMTRKERVAELENQKVLYGRVFDPDILTAFEHGGIRTTVKNVKILLEEETLGIILGVPMEGVWSIEGCQPSSGFSKQATKCGDIKRAGLPKKFLKGKMRQ